MFTNITWLYESVNTLRNDRVAKMDILWIGNGEIYKAGYRLNIDAEHRIKNFCQSRWYCDRFGAGCEGEL